MITIDKKTNTVETVSFRTTSGVISEIKLPVGLNYIDVEEFMTSIDPLYASSTRMLLAVLNVLSEEIRSGSSALEAIPECNKTLEEMKNLLLTA